MQKFYDTHCHLGFKDFDADLADVVQRAQAAGITRMITIGTTLESSRRAVEIAEQFPNVFAVVGWHPSYVTEAPADLRAELRELARHPRVVALGETGLDYHRLPSKKPEFTVADDEAYKRRQAELFQQHLEVATELGLNVVIHQRDCLADLTAQFEPFKGKLRGVFHCFSEDAATMRRILDWGSLVSFTGMVTFKGAQKVRETLAETPLNGFMLETDCPFLAPTPFRGKRCEPAYVTETAALVAQVKGCTLEELSAATSATADSFFRRR